MSMAARRPIQSLLSVRRLSSALHSKNDAGFLKTLESHPSSFPDPPLPLSGSILPHSLQKCESSLGSESIFRQGFSTTTRKPEFRQKREEDEGDSDEEGQEDYDDDDDDGEEEDDTDEEEAVSNRLAGREMSDAEKAEEAAAIGYRVIGQLQASERPFKPWEPVFAVIQIGSHQFKVCNGDCVYTERLKWCEVNDKLILSKVLMIGSKTQTIIGRPILPDTEVHAVVEEHAKDAKVIIFKKKRRKNYRRTKGHRQELTRLRITDIQGIEKPQTVMAA
ncbi:50S ribosomal protein L21, mitochondrial [Nymphaea colorata]|nr:50S ribosomal protein L21, mitochondrial [Nymphaea colorata]